PNRPDGVKLVIPESLKSPPKSWFPRHLHFVWRGIKEHYWGVEKKEKKPEAADSSASTCRFFGKGSAVVAPEAQQENVLAPAETK
ncbi:Hypothetical protein, putative, partial [Bodo saltans]